MIQRPKTKKTRSTKKKSRSRSKALSSKKEKNINRSFNNTFYKLSNKFPHRKTKSHNLYHKRGKTHF